MRHSAECIAASFRCAVENQRDAGMPYDGAQAAEWAEQYLQDGLKSCECSAGRLTLGLLAGAADWMGVGGEVVGLGGNVTAVALTVDGAGAFITLDDGQTVGTAWVVGLDGEARDDADAADRPIDSGHVPVTSDAEQTVRDAVAWVRHVVWGDALDGDA